MNRTAATLVGLAVSLALQGCATPGPSTTAADPSTPPEAASTEPTMNQKQRLDALFESYFEDALQLSPLLATFIGDHRYDDRLPNSIGPEYIASSRALNRKYLDAIRAATEKFDKIFFSYSISMIPPWRESIGNALRNLKPGGELSLVDFYDQRDLPAPFRRFLKWWLAKFHVKFWPELMPALNSLESNGIGRVTITALFRRYSFIAQIKAFTDQG